MRTEARSSWEETIAPSMGGVGSSRSPPTLGFPETSFRKSQEIHSVSESGSETSNRKSTTAPGATTAGPCAPPRVIPVGPTRGERFGGHFPLHRKVITSTDYVRLPSSRDRKSTRL